MTPRGDIVSMMRAYTQADGPMPTHLYRAVERGIRPVLRRYARPSEVPDLVQETFLRAHTARGSFAFDAATARPARVTAWFRSIARNVALDAVRAGSRRSRRHARAESTGISFVAESSFADTRSPEEHALESESREQTCEAVRRGIRRLGPTYRTVLVEHRLHGTPLAELARTEGVSRVAMRVRAHRGYKALARQLAGQRPSVCGL